MRPAQIFNLGFGIPMASSPLSTVEVGRRHNSNFVLRLIKELGGKGLGGAADSLRNSFPHANCLFLILLGRKIS